MSQGIITVLTLRRTVLCPRNSGKRHSALIRRIFYSGCFSWLDFIENIYPRISRDLNLSKKSLIVIYLKVSAGYRRSGIHQFFNFLINYAHQVNLLEESCLRHTPVVLLAEILIDTLIDTGTRAQSLRLSIWLHLHKGNVQDVSLV